MAKPATKKQRERWNRILDFGCSVAHCGKSPCIHHCETGRGRRKDHDKVIGLCYDHHQGKLGIHTLSRRIWEGTFGTEQDHMLKIAILLGEKNADDRKHTASN